VQRSSEADVVLRAKVVEEFTDRDETDEQRSDHDDWDRERDEEREQERTLAALRASRRTKPGMMFRPQCLRVQASPT
jgi:hypothetical protein